MSRFLSERFMQLREYVPGEQPQDRQYIKLNTNESPYPPSPEVIECLRREACADLRLYPDPDGSALRRKLAALYQVRTENILITNGSDEALSFAFMAYCDAECGVVFPDISYGFYRVFADLYALRCRCIPLREDFTICPEDYENVGATVVIANPNAPTGLALPAAAIEEIVRRNPENVVVVDEAYVDFGGESVIPLTKKYDNLLVIQTFSKSRSLAGARLGYAVGNASLIADLNRLRNSTNPYNVNRMTLAAGEAAIDSQSYYDANCIRIMETRERTAAALRELGCTVLPSCTNFLFVESARTDGATLYRQLREKGILVRHFDAPRIRNFVRITIGTPDDMQRTTEAVRAILCD